MNIEQDFLSVLSELNHDPLASHPVASTITPLIDLTLLNQDASEMALNTLQSKLNAYPVAAVCVYPQHLKKLNVPSSIKKATVVNFPEGLLSSERVCQDIDTIIQNNAVDEIDYVLPQGAALEDEPKALDHCNKAYQQCAQHQITFKVILETGAIANADRIYTLSKKIIEQGCDFLKTSTGTTPVGATPLAAYAILRAIQDSGSVSGLKVSGGVKLPQQAWFYIALAEHCLGRKVNKDWFRIGASSLLDELLLLDS
ncbi:MAG: hypothetical protein A3F46_08360 [Legionellales bacterium RIFCSPHIGHO2_12_FULL_42_9]|nr:MAG: hypothetical protein A3F46_08360 [Legionellales bacterium RIFCSPHIGHO2_12_FULL_42_9]